MKKFLIRAVKFSFPVFIYFLIIIIVDPYNYFSLFSLIPSERKEKISFALNSPLWKLCKYSESKTNNLLLGDSRMRIIEESIIKQKTGEEFFNAYVGGGSLKEIIESFWYFNSMNKNLKNVYIGVNIEMYNKVNIRNRVDGVIAIMKNPLLYLINYNVIESSYHLLRSYFSDKIVPLDKPELMRDDFWNAQLKDASTRYYSKYIYPDNYYSELREIAGYCKRNNINLVFIVFPTHIDLQNQLRNYNLFEQNSRFLDEIRSFGTLYDFNLPNTITSNRNNFNDPFHMKTEVFNKYYSGILFSKSLTSNDSTLFKIFK